MPRQGKEGAGVDGRSLIRILTPKNPSPSSVWTIARTGKWQWRWGKEEDGTIGSSSEGRNEKGENGGVGFSFLSEIGRAHV